jgi:methionyl aminopeptidase
MSKEELAALPAAEIWIPTMSDAERTVFNFPGTVRPGLITPKRHVPAGIARPDYADDKDGRSAAEEADNGGRIKRYEGDALARVREVCRLSREVLDLAIAAVRPGVRTDEIDRIVHEATVARGMYPSPLNYYGFPKSCCTSVNEIICHGIPDNTVLQEGDIINLDISSYLGGVHADLNETVFVGAPKDVDTVRLVHCAYECMMAGISVCKPGALYKQVGNAIHDRADVSGFSVVRTYSGHGVGALFHTTPSIPHYRDNKCAGVMAAGHVFTIEPMINIGVWQDVTWPDRWTSTTRDGKRSAQFEHTMVITANGVELLTDYVDSVPTYRKQLAALKLAIDTTYLTPAERDVLRQRPYDVPSITSEQRAKRIAAAPEEKAEDAASAPAAAAASG